MRPAAYLWAAPPAPVPAVRGCGGDTKGSGPGAPEAAPTLSCRGVQEPRPSTPRRASPTAIPCPLPRPRARGSGRARARAPRCARAPAGRRPPAASGARRGPAGGGCGGAGGRVPASEPRPRPAACPVARLEEAGQVRTGPRPPRASPSAGPSGQRHPVARGAHCARPSHHLVKQSFSNSPAHCHHLGPLELPKSRPHTVSGVGTRAPVFIEVRPMIPTHSRV